jgi:hypothetical protein
MGLDIIEMVMEVETAFAIEIPDYIGPYLSTVGALYDYVVTHVQPPPAGLGPGVYSGELWERYLDIVARESGVRRERLRPTARFVADLQMD